MNHRIFSNKSLPVQMMFVMLGLIVLLTLLPPDRAVAQRQDDVRSIVWSPDGSMIALSGGPIGCRENEPERYKIPIIRVSDGATLKELVGMTCTSSWLDWSSDNSNRLLSLRLTQSIIYIWDVVTGNLIRSFPTQTQGTLSAKWSPDGNIIASSHPGNYVILWDPNTGQRIGVSSIGGTSFAWNPQDATRMVTGDNLSSALSIWDVTTGQEIFPLQGVTDATYLLDWSKDGRRIASVDIDKAHIWNASNGQLLVSLSIPDVSDARLNFDGTRLATVTVNGLIQVWNANTGDLLDTITTSERLVTLAWSPDGSQIAYSGPTRVLQLADVPTPVCNTTIPASDTAALISAIITANGAATPQTLCLTNSIYTLDPIPTITGDITIIGNGATIELPTTNGFNVTDDGSLTLSDVTVRSTAD